MCSEDRWWIFEDRKTNNSGTILQVLYILTEFFNVKQQLTIDTNKGNTVAILLLAQAFEQ